MTAITIIIQPCTGSSRECNKTRKLHGKCNHWERRGGFVSVCRSYNHLSGKSNEKALELMWEFIKFVNYKIKILKSIALKYTEITILKM